MTDLADRPVQPVPADAVPFNLELATELLAELPEWVLSEDHTAIERTFHFRDYYHTMAFVNAVAWIAHHTDHHPDLEVGYNRCVVRYTTHAIGGLSENDFICAARIDRLDA